MIFDLRFKIFDKLISRYETSMAEITSKGYLYRFASSMSGHIDDRRTVFDPKDIQ